MTEQHDFGGRLRTETAEPTNWENLVDLANEKLAFIYQRLSTHEQVKRHIWSREAQDDLVNLAQRDGYPNELIYVERRDLGISGTKTLEDRPGLAYFIQSVEADLVEAAYVIHISRLYRDQTLINALALGELLKEHGVIIVTPQMRLNLRDKMHMRLYRMEVERAADELELMAGRLTGARDLKARSGRYGGENLPPGYVLDMCKELPNGDPNPTYHSFRIHKPHAKVVRVIFDQLAVPGMTPTQVARWCSRQDNVFPPFPPELDTPENRKAFTQSKRNGSGWLVTVRRVRSITANPAYIGWRIWGGEVVSKDAFPPIVDETTFWAVQERLGDRRSRPKKEQDPLPLAGLLYCGDHDVPCKMTYHNQKPVGESIYQCLDVGLQTTCFNIVAHILDRPISEAVITQVALPELAEEVLDKLTDEYEQAKEQAAGYRREMKRLEAEVENLRGNLATGILSADQVKWIDEQIQGRLARIRELADLESRPIGQAMGRSTPGKADIDLVRSFLANLGEKWPRQPNGLKNAFLRLLLDKVVIRRDGPLTIRAKLVWRVGLEQEMMIHRPSDTTKRRWSSEEVETVRKHFETAGMDELMGMLPGRTWKAIHIKGQELGLSRIEAGRNYDKSERRYTPEEDELVRRYYAGEINLEEAQATGRTVSSIRTRASRLGLKLQREATWEWCNPTLQEGRSSRPEGERRAPPFSDP